MLISVLAIPGLPEHVRAARAFTGLVLGAHGIDDDGVSRLLVSELVTNSVLHSGSGLGGSGLAGGTVTVMVAVAPGGVLVEVSDDGGGEPVPRDAGADGENGRGLHLVRELADAWGHIAADGRLTTWFQLKTPTTGSQPTMNECPCDCGYTAASPEGLRDHLAEAFTPDDDTAPDGQRHAEAARASPRDGTRLACLCGATADSVTGLDDHLLRAFTPDSRVGVDGRRHAGPPSG
jgi:anti-sigma regulatory factor (Ser/Thr protein kinase)